MKCGASIKKMGKTEGETSKAKFHLHCEDEKNDNNRKDIIDTINKNLMKLNNKED